MAASTGFFNPLGLEVLNRNNYKRWRLRVKTYLLAEDLWEVVETVTDHEPPTPSSNSSSKKDAKALYAIQTSCGPEMFHYIGETETAKGAWDALERVSRLTGDVENNVENFKPFIQFSKFVSEGEWEMAKECLKLKDLDIHTAVRARDPRNEFGDTVIHLAARKGHMNILKELMLLMTQDDLKMKNGNDYTALHVAAWDGQLNTVKELVLLMGGETTGKGDTALHVAAQRGKVDVVKELVKRMKPNDVKIINNDGYTALHIAVQKENLAVVKELGVLMGEVRGPDGDTSLHIAVKMGATRIVKELLSLMRREYMAIKNDEGYTAIHLAVKNENVPIVKEFVRKTKDRDFDSYIQFTTFVTQGEWDNAKECLTKLDDPCDGITIVDPRNGYGNTALHLAAKEGHALIAKNLITLLKERQDNRTPENSVVSDCGIHLDDVEVRKKAKDMVEQYEKLLPSILDVRNTEGSTALHIAVSEGNLDIVKDLVPLMTKEGLEIQDVLDSTPLHYAADKGYIEIVKELVLFMRQEGLEIQDSKGYTALLRAVDKGHSDIAKELMSLMRPEGLELKTTKQGYNALHLGIMKGHMNIAREVMPLMRVEALEEKDGEGYTALACALDVRKNEDVMEIANYMAVNNNKVFGIRFGSPSRLPVIKALYRSQWDLCRDLYKLTPLEYLEPEHGIDGAHLIIYCIRAKKMDMALDLLRRCSKLSIAISQTGYGISPLMELARMSAPQLGFWRRLVYDRFHVEPANLSSLQTCINIPTQEDNQDKQMNFLRSVITLCKKLVHRLCTLLGVNQLREMKQIYIRSIDALSCISDILKEGTPTSLQFTIVKRSVFRAVEHGNVEFVTRICEACPSLLNSYEDDKHIFHLAVECRQPEIYSLIYGFDEEKQTHFGSRVTKYPENMLHLAGKLSPLSRFNRIRGAALQMQRELQWFLEVENVVPIAMRESSTSDVMTPRELFSKNHEKLKMEAEDSMKGTATSCTVIGSLIVTMMFAAAFTVPGGNNGDTGAPIFLVQKLFLVFIISDTVSLVSSTTSVIIFLGILTSRYAEDDFLKNLPTKMMIGLFTLFISIGTMMIAFSCALLIMFKIEYSWAIVPTIVAAIIPVFSFTWLQFPLLIEIFWSTYGPGIFDKKVKPWIKRDF